MTSCLSLVLLFSLSVCTFRREGFSRRTQISSDAGLRERRRFFRYRIVKPLSTMSSTT
jgi:hypothetical protein